MLRSTRFCLKFFTVAYAVAIPQGVFAETATNNSSERIEKRWTSSPVDHWQTYSQSGSNGVHKFIESEHSYKIKKISPPSKKFRTGYAFVHNGSLYFEDRANHISYKKNWLGGYTSVNFTADSDYSALGYNFQTDSYSGSISACPLPNDRKCKIFSFQPGTFPYVYAKNEGAVLSITNYGDALLFKDGEWCRMSMHNDVYSCANPELTQLTKPRAIQFYSSITYQGKVLLGEWPTGRLYEFDGTELKPSSMTPPKIAELANQRLGYEAQTMAEYCGDLFVGYWPKGEVWRYDHTARVWKFFNRFFSNVKGETFIPYSDREVDGLDSSFFGQRVTAMVPFEGALYVTTSNLRTWTSSDSAPETIAPSKVAEYGAIYKVTKPGCTTNYSYAKNYN